MADYQDRIGDAANPQCAAGNAGLFPAIAERRCRQAWSSLRLFLSAERSSSLAASGWRGRDCWIAKAWDRASPGLTWTVWTPETCRASAQSPKAHCDHAMGALELSRCFSCGAAILVSRQCGPARQTAALPPGVVLVRAASKGVPLVVTAEEDNARGFGCQRGRRIRILLAAHDGIQGRAS
jgi:hypothetical protein